jgi:hypothetical protein
MNDISIILLIIGAFVVGFFWSRNNILKQNYKILSDSKNVLEIVFQTLCKKLDLEGYPIQQTIDDILETKINNKGGRK